MLSSSEEIVDRQYIFKSLKQSVSAVASTRLILAGVGEETSHCVKGSVFLVSPEVH